MKSIEEIIKLSAQATAGEIFVPEKLRKHVNTQQTKAGTRLTKNSMAFANESPKDGKHYWVWAKGGSDWQLSCYSSHTDQYHTFTTKLRSEQVERVIEQRLRKPLHLNKMI